MPRSSNRRHLLPMVSYLEIFIFISTIIPQSLSVWKWNTLYLVFILNQEILSRPHIDNLVLKGKERHKIFKYISGKSWGADAETLRNTYTTLILPILEYGVQVYHVAADNLKRVQLAAARAITGLRNNCPGDIVLHEADLQPLRLRSRVILAKYFSKLISYGSEHRTSYYICEWNNNQRLKRCNPQSF